MQKKSTKIRHLGTIAQLCWAISSQLRHVLTIGKSLLNSNISPTCPYNMVNFSPVAAQIGSLVWAPQLILMGLRLGSITARHSSCGGQPNFAALNRKRHLYSAGRPSRRALAHILVSTACRTSQPSVLLLLFLYLVGHVVEISRLRRCMGHSVSSCAQTKLVGGL